MRHFGSLLIFLILGSFICAQAQKKSAKVAPTAAKPDLGDFDLFVNQALKDWKVPGVAVAVVQGGKIILSKGYGYRAVAVGGSGADSIVQFA